MKRHLLILAFIFLFTACSGEEENGYTVGNPDDITIAPEGGADATINEALFDVINLDYPGLENVKTYYDNGKLYQAASALLTYYRMRSTVFNTNVDLMNPTCSESDINMAKQATAAGGYRFYVRNYEESKDAATGLAVYYSFAASKDSVNWEYAPKGVTDQEWFSQKHRLQWMSPQAKAYRATGNEDYAKAWIDVYGQWLKAYPCPEGKTNSTQWSGLQTCERIIDQVDIFEYYKQSENFTPAWLSTFLVAFSQGVENIRNNPFEPATSNIRLAQNQAELYAGILMPEFKNAPTWLTEGAAAITAQLKSQFNEDGVQNELDPSYHLGVLSNFISTYTLVSANEKNASFPSDYTSYLKNAAHFLMDIVYPDYTWEYFNDSRKTTKNVVLRNLRNYAKMFPDDADLAFASTEGTGGAEPGRDIRMYKTSGYYIMRNGWSKDATMLILKNNYNPDNKWHCQPDNGTIGLYSKGRHFLPDAGVFTYGGDSELDALRNVYRGTQLHNTMNRNGKTIDGSHQRGQYLASGNANGAEYVVTKNDSYDDLSHRRAIFYVNKEFFVIADEGYGSGSGFPVQICFNLCETKNDVVPDDAYSDGGYGMHTIFSDNNNMIFKTFTETTEGYAATNTTGYYSPAINEKVQRRLYRVSITKPSDGAARFITVIFPFKAVGDFDTMSISAKFTDNEGGKAGTFHESGASLEVSVNGTKYNLAYTLK